MSLPVAEFFNTGLEVSAVYTHGGNSGTVSGHFLDEYEPLGAGVQFESSAPLFYAQTSDISDAVNGDTLVISGTTYYIREKKPDGEGVTLLVLSKE